MDNKTALSSFISDFKVRNQNRLQEMETGEPELFNAVKDVLDFLSNKYGLGEKVELIDESARLAKIQLSQSVTNTKIPLQSWRIVASTDYGDYDFYGDNWYSLNEKFTKIFSNVLVVKEADIVKIDLDLNWEDGYGETITFRNNYLLPELRKLSVFAEADNFIYQNSKTDKDKYSFSDIVSAAAPTASTSRPKIKLKEWDIAFTRSNNDIDKSNSNTWKDLKGLLSGFLAAYPDVKLIILKLKWENNKVESFGFDGAMLDNLKKMSDLDLAIQYIYNISVVDKNTYSFEDDPRFQTATNIQQGVAPSTSIGLIEMDHMNILIIKKDGLRRFSLPIYKWDELLDSIKNEIKTYKQKDISKIYLNIYWKNGETDEIDLNPWSARQINGMTDKRLFVADIQTFWISKQLADKTGRTYQNYSWKDTTNVQNATNVQQVTTSSSNTSKYVIKEIYVAGIPKMGSRVQYFVYEWKNLKQAVLKVINSTSDIDYFDKVEIQIYWDGYNNNPEIYEYDPKTLKSLAELTDANDNFIVNSLKNKTINKGKDINKFVWEDDPNTTKNYPAVNKPIGNITQSTQPKVEIDSWKVIIADSVRGIIEDEGVRWDDFNRFVLKIVDMSTIEWVSIFIIWENKIMFDENINPKDVDTWRDFVKYFDKGEISGFIKEVFEASTDESPQNYMFKDAAVLTTTPPSPTPSVTTTIAPKKRGRPKKIDEVKSVDDLEDLDINDLDV